MQSRDYRLRQGGVIIVTLALKLTTRKRIFPPHRERSATFLETQPPAGKLPDD